MKEKKLAFILDYDGCLGEKSTADIIQRNKKFFSYVIQKIKIAFSEGLFESCKIILVIGSNRQTPQIDSYCMNKNKNGSCATLLPSIQKGLEESLSKNGDLASKVIIELCKFMIPDLYNEKKSGTTYALMESQSQSDTLGNIFDKKKISVIYGLTQHIAFLNSEDKIEFYFFDDILDEILVPLNIFFSRQTHCLPKTCELTLIHYAQNNIQKVFEPIVGLGEIQKINKADFTGFIDKNRLKEKPDSEKYFSEPKKESTEHMNQLMELEAEYSDVEGNLLNSKTFEEESTEYVNQRMVELEAEDSDVEDNLLNSKTFEEESKESEMILKTCDDFIIVNLETLTRNLKALAMKTIADQLSERMIEFNCNELIKRIEHNYRLLSRKYHPDKNLSGDAKNILLKLQKCLEATKRVHEIGEIAGLIKPPGAGIASSNHGDVLSNHPQRIKRLLTMSFNAAELGNLEHFKENFRVSDNYLIDSQDTVEKTFLIYAVIKGNVEFVKELLDRGANVHIRDMLDNTALHYAVEENFIDIMKLLIAKGANPYSLNDRQICPLLLSVIKYGVNDQIPVLSQSTQVLFIQQNTQAESKAKASDGALVVGTSKTLSLIPIPQSLEKVIPRDYLNLLEEGPNGLLKKLYVIYFVDQLPFNSVINCGNNSNNSKNNFVEKGLVPQASFHIEAIIDQSLLYNKCCQSLNCKYVILEPVTELQEAGNFIGGDLEICFITREHTLCKGAIILIPVAEHTSFHNSNSSYEGYTVGYNSKTNLFDALTNVLLERDLLNINHYTKSIYFRKNDCSSQYKALESVFIKYAGDAAIPKSAFEKIKYYMGCFKFTVDERGRTLFRPLSVPQALELCSNIQEELKKLSISFFYTPSVPFIAWKKQIRDWLAIYLGALKTTLEKPHDVDGKSNSDSCVYDLSRQNKSQVTFTDEEYARSSFFPKGKIMYTLDEESSDNYIDNIGKSTTALSDLFSAWSEALSSESSNTTASASSAAAASSSPGLSHEERRKKM